jgi:hypothetical protein
VSQRRFALWRRGFSRHASCGKGSVPEPVRFPCECIERFLILLVQVRIMDLDLLVRDTRQVVPTPSQPAEERQCWGSSDAGTPTPRSKPHPEDLRYNRFDLACGHQFASGVGIGRTRRGSAVSARTIGSRRIRKSGSRRLTNASRTGAWTESEANERCETAAGVYPKSAASPFGLATRRRGSDRTPACSSMRRAVAT